MTKQKTNREIANEFEFYDDVMIIADRKKAAAIILQRLRESGAVD